MTGDDLTGGDLTGDGAAGVRLSLAERYPQVAALWHLDRNGALTAAQVTAKTARKVWWRCPAGHEWQEAIATRTAMPAWKLGDVAACRQCTGFRVQHTYDCGHTLHVTADKAAALAADPKPRCWPCETAWRAANQDRVTAELAQAYAAATGDVAQLVDAVAIQWQVQKQAPPVLVAEWRRWAVHELRYATAAQQCLGRSGAVEASLRRVSDQAAALLPSLDDLRRADQDDGVVKLMGRAHWAAGWLHHLTEQPPRPAPTDLLQQMTDLLAGWLGEWQREDRPAATTTAQITAALTGEVREFARALQPGPARAYREVQIPVLRPKARRYGRLDVLIHRTGRPAIAVEIDAQPNPHSAAKLTFARDTGALPIWIRFGTSQRTAPDGITVIHLEHGPPE